LEVFSCTLNESQGKNSDGSTMINMSIAEGILGEQLNLVEGQLKKEQSA
jgi:hypothetical protein